MISFNYENVADNFFLNGNKNKFFAMVINVRYIYAWIANIFRT